LAAIGLCNKAAATAGELRGKN